MAYIESQLLIFLSFYPINTNLVSPMPIYIMDLAIFINVGIELTKMPKYPLKYVHLFLSLTCANACSGDGVVVAGVAPSDGVDTVVVVVGVVSAINWSKL
jgi:hypothetical protein